MVEAFRQGLRDLGYIEQRNILVELRYVEGQADRIPSLVAELVQLKVDVLVSGTFPAIRAAKQATNTIPIVMVTAQNPVEAGLVDSLAHPGGNITGVTRLTRDLSGKRLELLKEMIPKVLRVGALWDVDAPGASVAFKEYDAAARALKIELQPLKVRGPNPDFGERISSRRQSACERVHPHQECPDWWLPKTHCGPRREESTSFDVRGYSVRRGWWPYVLLGQRY
jgi:putative ABC transport system substrate-binding protein